MAVDLIKGNGGANLLQSLMQSEMLEIACLNTFQDPTTLCIPAILACAVSERFSELLTTKHNLNVAELLGEDQASFEKRVAYDFHSLFTSFIEWLYTSSVPKSCLAQHADLWHLGQLLGAPRFQNAILLNFTVAEKRKWRSRTKVVVDFPCSILEGFTSYQSLQGILEQVKFALAMVPGYNDDDDNDGEEFFADKQLLKFFVDCLAHVGFDHAHYKQVIHGGGNLAEQMTSTANAVMKAPDCVACPWSEEGIGPYLVDENAAVRRVACDGAEIREIIAEEPQRERERKQKLGQEHKVEDTTINKSMDTEMIADSDNSPQGLSDSEEEAIHTAKEAMDIARSQRRLYPRPSSLPANRRIRKRYSVRLNTRRSCRE